MAYVRKTYDEWWIMTNYGYGWEYETAEETAAAARDMAKCYRENSFGQYAVRVEKHRIKKEK